MPLYDLVCDAGHEQLDRLLPMNDHNPPCHCGAATQTLWKGKGSAVIQDSIEGGVEIRHGLCNEDGTPRRYYSHSEINREAKRRGMVNFTRHRPLRGTDKSTITTRWV